MDGRQHDIDRNVFRARRAQRRDDPLETVWQLLGISVAHEHVGREPSLHARQFPEVLAADQVFPILQRVMIETVGVDVEGLAARHAADCLAQSLPRERMHHPAAPGRRAAEHGFLEIGRRLFLAEEFLEIDRPDHMGDLRFSRGNSGQDRRRLVGMRAVEASVIGVEAAHRCGVRIEAEYGARGTEEDNIERLRAAKVFEAFQHAVAVGGQPQFEGPEIVRHKPRPEDRKNVARGRNGGDEREQRDGDAECGGKPAAHGQNRK